LRGPAGESGSADSVSVDGVFIQAPVTSIE
jgi:hypothetical protein